MFIFNSFIYSLVGLKIVHDNQNFSHSYYLGSIAMVAYHRDHSQLSLSLVVICLQWLMMQSFFLNLLVSVYCQTIHILPKQTSQKMPGKIKKIL